MSGDLLPPLAPSPRPDPYARVYDGPIARFADSRIHDSIMRATAVIPEGEHVAVVPFLNSKGDARFAGIVRINNHWSAMGVFEHSPSAGNSWEVAGLWHI